jgi:hypothetical protein
MKRKVFLKTMSLGLLGSAMPLYSKPISEFSSDPIPVELVHEFVGKAHSDFSVVKKLLEEHPHILNACYDWGDGDYETALGAMGHMGHRDEALELIEHGARADIFVLTMLGEDQLIIPVLERFPNLMESIGPHGLSLLYHAEKGGAHAAVLTEYLLEKGMTERKVPYFDK